MENGIIENFNEMEEIWRHTFYNELRVAPEEHPLLITEKTEMPNSNREKIAQIMFESFSVPSIYLAKQSFLSLLASGRTTGIVVDSGDGKTEIVQIYESKTFYNSVSSFPIAGRDITNNLMRMLNLERECQFYTTSDREIVRSIKEHFCYVALDFEKEMQTCFSSSTLEKFFELPDGRVITLGSERFKSTEPLFNSSQIIFHGEQESLSEKIFESILKTDFEFRNSFFSNVILSGGNTMFPGFVNRIEKELVALAPSTSKIKIIAPPERKLSVWIGGSILSSFSNFQNTYSKSKDDYDEVGPSIVRYMKL
jgi:actin